MNKVTLLVILIFATNLFSQNVEKKSIIEEMENYYNKGKIEKLEFITNEILSGKYGELDDELKFYTLMYSSNVYTRDEYLKKDSQKGYDKSMELLSFAQTTTFTIPNKDVYIKSMSDFLNNLKNKYPEIVVANFKPNYKTVSDTKSEKTSNSQKELNENKTVTLTVSGTGKTLEEAKLNALRSAIEQAFGTFISSKTEILNDNLIKDEIVSVSSGNVEKYEIISQVEVPKIGFATTLSAIVSIEKLTSFAESKGVVVEFKGGMFGMKIKLQKLNEASEIEAIKNLTSTCFDILSNSIDFELIVSEPKKESSGNEGDDYSVDFRIKTKSNTNYTSFINYFKETLSKLSLSKLESEDYEKLNKNIYYIKIDGVVYKFRTEKTNKWLSSFFASSPILVTSFKIYSNLGVIKYSFYDLFKDNYGNLKPYYCLLSAKDYYSYYYTYHPIDRLFKSYIINLKELNKSNLLFNELDSEFLKDENEGFQLGAPIYFDTKFIEKTFTFSKTFKLSEIENINEIKLEKININDFLQNRKKYMDEEPSRTFQE